MSRTRSCLKLGRISILYLFLALAFNGKASDAKHTEFGCEFADKQYKMIQSNKKQPVWSNTTIDSKPFKMEYQWYAKGMGYEPIITIIIDKIEEPLTQLFSERNIINEVSLFTRLVKKYKQSVNSLETFFDNYDVPFQSKTYYKSETTIRNTTDPASYLIQELHALQERLKSLNKSVSPYLVSAYVDPIQDKPDEPEELYFLRLSYNFKKLLHKRVQEHIAAVIKIKTDNRPGYILIDPGYVDGEKMFQPFVVYVMQDGKPPHGKFLAGYDNNYNDFKFTVRGGRGNSYIVASHSRLSKARHVIYYTHKPYCSFMENTVKANLLRLNHGIIARYKNGNQWAYLTFKISKQFDGFNLRQFAFQFDAIQKQRNFTTVTEEVKDTIREYFFSIPTEEVNIMTDPLDFIRSDVLGKEDFMSKFSNLIERDQRDQRDQRDNPIKSFFQNLSSFFINNSCVV